MLFVTANLIVPKRWKLETNQCAQRWSTKKGFLSSQDYQLLFNNHIYFAPILFIL